MTQTDREGSGGTRSVSEAEFERIVEACRDIDLRPADLGGFSRPDYVYQVLETVLDLQMQTAVVARSMQFYADNRWNETRTLQDLEALLARSPDDKEGNREVAQYLWGTNHWTRVQWLRGFVRFLARDRLTSYDELRDWAMRARFGTDFAGQAKHLGIAAFQSLRIRMGVDTAKPDVHLRRFVERLVGHSFTDDELIRVIEEVARRLEVRAQDLDLAIWELQRGGPPTIGRGPAV